MSNTIELSDDTLKITRIFDAPRDMVFGAWSDPESIQAWAGCADAESLEADVDFRVGGGYRLTTQEMRENTPSGWTASLDRLATTISSTSRRD